jgi:hypothetical protein
LKSIPLSPATIKSGEEGKQPKKRSHYKNPPIATSKKEWVIHETRSFLVFAVHVFDRKHGQNYLVYVRVGEKALVGLLLVRYS